MPPNQPQFFLPLHACLVHLASPPLHRHQARHSQPNNSAQNSPEVYAIFVLFNSITGQPLTSMDVTALTLYLSTSVYALASSYLSREDTEILVMVSTNVSALASSYLSREDAKILVMVSSTLASLTQGSFKSLMREFDGEAVSVNSILWIYFTDKFWISRPKFEFSLVFWSDKKMQPIKPFEMLDCSIFSSFS